MSAPILESDNKKIFDVERVKIDKELRQNDNLVGDTLDPKRQISPNQKQVVWNHSTSHSSFDEKIFRCDPFGSVAIKNLNHNNASKEQKKFVFDYEHLVAHSLNGRSIPENICILNAGINRSKGSKPITDVDFYHYKGLVVHFGITFDGLLEDLENDLHLCCEHYDLYFYKNNRGQWTIDFSFDEKNYQNYHLQKNYKPKPLLLRRNKEVQEMEAMIVVGAVAAGTFLATANVIGTQIYKYGNSLVDYFTEKTPELPKKKEEPSVFTATAIGTATLSVLALCLKAYITIETKPSRRRRQR